MTEIWILDGQLNRITKVQSPYPLDAGGTILKYSKELDEYGQLSMRISAYDKVLTQLGDIVAPHKNWVQVVKDGTTIWQGAIIDNPKRTKEYIEILAAEPLWYLSKILVNRSSPDPTGAGQNGIYRVFNSGTMAAAVTAIINETITNFQTKSAGHPLASMTLGTVTNPNYPANMTDGNNPPNQLTGAWNFGNGITAPELQYDFTPILTILKDFGIYSYSDFYLDNSLVFNFVPFKGRNLTNLVTFQYGGPNNPTTNIIDYNVPRSGQRMYNSLWGIATDPNGNVLNYDSTDQTSIGTYGVIEGVAAFADVKDQATLNARLEAELPLISSPNLSSMTVTLNEKAAYPLGLYDVGDIVNFNIQNKGVRFSDAWRIVGITVTLNGTGRETTTVQSNKPLPSQVASLGA